MAGSGWVGPSDWALGGYELGIRPTNLGQSIDITMYITNKMV
jgi:hypothetical protein